MQCPDCPGTLDFVFVLETTDPDRPVIIDHQWLRCPACATRFFAILVEDRTHIFSDDLEHTGYRAAPQDWERSLRRARACPTPRDKRCTCPVHASPPRCHGAQAWCSS